MDLKIGSINARGLGDRSKRRVFFNWLRKNNKWPYILFKKLIVLKKKICMTGELNRIIRLFSVVALAKRQALSYCLKILSPFKFREHTATLRDAL